MNRRQPTSRTAVDLYLSEFSGVAQLSTPGASTTFDKQSRALSDECSTGAVQSRNEVAQVLGTARAEWLREGDAQALTAKLLRPLTQLNK